MAKLTISKAAVLIFLMIIGLTVAVSFVDFTWESWKPATCMPDGCFCEALRDGILRQPANTWSSLGFILVALLIFGQARRDVSLASPSRKTNPFMNQPFVPGLYSFSLIVIGLGGTFYHASLTFVGQFFDLIGMYFFVVFALLYNIKRWYTVTRARTIPTSILALAYLILILLLAYALLVFPELRRYIFGALIVLALVPEFLIRRQSKPMIQTGYLSATLVIGVMAFVIWILDNAKILCVPYSWLQGHAAWHLLGALATGSLYLYYRSER